MALSSVMSAMKTFGEPAPTFERPPPFPPSRMGKWLTVEGTEPQSSLWVQWQTRDLTAEYACQPLEYIDHLLSYDGTDSFVGNIVVGPTSTPALSVQRL